MLCVNQLAAAPAPVAGLLQRVQRRIVLESIAGITPIVCERVAPPRRRFLSTADRDRRPLRKVA